MAGSPSLSFKRYQGIRNIINTARGISRLRRFFFIPYLASSLRIKKAVLNTINRITYIIPSLLVSASMEKNTG